ncbi:MAG TPA: hypothetical protein VF789_08465 [Thermoanaerobaculia bacterium]
MTHSASQRRLIAFALITLFAVPAAWSVGQVSGKYLGNGKEAKLAHAVIVPHDPWEGETTYTVVLSEKDPAGIKKPDFDATFGKLGDALVVAITRKGDIIGTEVCHQSLKRAGFSSTGTLLVENFKLADGQMSGRFFTKGQKTFFDDSWEIDLTFKGKLP